CATIQPKQTPGGEPRSSRRKEAQIKLGSQNSEFGIRQSLLTSAATSFRRREPASRREEALLLSHFECRIFKVSLLTSAATADGLPAIRCATQSRHVVNHELTFWKFQSVYRCAM